MLRLTYFVMGLTHSVVIMVSVVSTRYVKILGMTLESNACASPHSIHVWRRSWASLGSQMRILAHWADSSTFPGPL